MSFDQAIAFLLFAVVAAVTPGPSNTMILATATTVGAWRALPCALGAAAGMGLLLFVSALGLGQIALAQPLLLKVLNWGGAAFLLWLAWRIAKAGKASDPGQSKAVGFLGAAAFQWANPKGWLVAVSAAGTYLQAKGGGEWRQAFVLGTLFFAAALPSGLLWLVLGSAVRRLVQSERYARVFNIVMGLALAASVVMILR